MGSDDGGANKGHPSATGRSVSAGVKVCGVFLFGLLLVCGYLSLTASLQMVKSDVDVYIK